MTKILAALVVSTFVLAVSQEHAQAQTQNWTNMPRTQSAAPGPLYGQRGGVTLVFPNGQANPSVGAYPNAYGFAGPGATANRGGAGAMFDPFGGIQGASPQQQTPQASQGQVQPGQTVDGTNSALPSQPSLPNAEQGTRQRGGDGVAGRNQSAALTSAPMGLIAVGEIVSGRAESRADGNLVIGGTAVRLDSAQLLPAMEVCGDDRQVNRCGAVSQDLAASVLSRIPSPRCVVVTAQQQPGGEVSAWCTSGREDLAMLLVKGGAARADDARLGWAQAEAIGDRRGIWAGSPSTGAAERRSMRPLSRR